MGSVSNLTCIPGRYKRHLGQPRTYFMKATGRIATARPGD